jgi:hypothetical protein
VLEALERVDAELRRIHATVRNFVAWPDAARDEAQNAFATLRRAFAITRETRAEVLDPERLAHSARVRESSLRARTVVLAMQLSELEHFANTAANLEPTAFAEDVTCFRAHVLRHVGVVNARWSLATRALATDDDEIVGRLLDVAEAEFLALGRDPATVRFLARGISHEHQVVAMACRVVAALLEVPTEALEVPVLPSLRPKREVG